MTDTKLPLNDAFQQLSDKLNYHDTLITSFQQTVDSLQSQINSLKNDINQHWSEVTNNFQTITSTITELKSLLSSRPNAPPPPPPTSTPHTSSFSIHTHSPDKTDTPFPFITDTPPRLPAPTTTTAIVVPPVSSFPTFSGKPSERPRQFLLQVVEYARTIHHWSNDTLLRGISQFLTDAALEWYCQLCVTAGTPNTWPEFVTSFLAQFHSPLRIAQRETEWKECTQKENETINEFLVRLRSLWLEQKPKETEPDFIKHLFCKMRPDMLLLMNNHRASPLEDIIQEAQKIEEILYRRNKEQRDRTSTKPKNSASTTAIPSLFALYPPQNPLNHQPLTKVKRSPTCWRCYETGHYAPNCPLNANKFHSSTTDYQPLPPRSKNL